MPKVSRPVLLFLASRLLTTLSYQIQTIAVGWQVYEIRKNPLDLGWVGLAQFVPMVAFSLLGGQIADRFERKRIINTVQFFWALSCFLLFFISRLPELKLSHFMLILFIQGTLRAFSNPASFAFVTQLVPSTELNRTVALNSSVWQVSMISGPMLGGWLYALWGSADYVYLTSAVSLLLGALLLTQVEASPTEKTTDPWDFKNFFTGVAYVFKNRMILGSISLDLFAVLFGGAVALLPAYASDILKIGPAGLGWLRSAPGIGATVMSLYLAGRPIKSHLGFWLFFNVALFGLATVVFGISRTFWLSWIALWVTGAADVVSVVIRMTLVQVETPPSMRGRVSAVNSIFISASNELGEFESGVTASWFGVVPSVVIGGLGSVVIAILWAIGFPELRKMDKLKS